MERLPYEECKKCEIYNGNVNKCFDECYKPIEALEELREYKQLEEQGLLLKLPCNVGDTVYTNFSMQGWYMRKKDRPYKAKIVFVGINGADNFMNVDLGKGAMLSFKFSDIGKTVFLTEQEAQSALEKMKEGEQNG